jgi:hypothetical protein
MLLINVESFKSLVACNVRFLSFIQKMSIKSDPGPAIPPVSKIPDPTGSGTGSESAKPLSVLSQEARQNFLPNFSEKIKNSSHIRSYISL